MPPDGYQPEFYRGTMQLHFLRNYRSTANTIVVALIACISVAGAVSAADNEVSTPPEFKHLKYRLVGPSAGGRVCRVAGVPGDPRTYYVASASGGIWKSADGGASWKAVTDDQPLSTVGSIALAPSNPNVIYAGSGETNIRGDVVPGNGIFKSTDAGKHWQHVWKQEGQIGTLVVHPSNPDIAYAAVLGHAFGPNRERGVYRTTDGGKNWQQVLFKNVDTGASDVCIDPSNPQVLFAGFWQARRLPWDLISGGPGGGLYVSRDGGDTWKQLGPGTADETAESSPGKGLPKGPWGKIGVAVAPSDSRRIYVLIEAENGGLFRSDDGGDSWSLVHGDRDLRQRAWYYSTITVDPKNPDVVFCPQVGLMRSIDGGKTFSRVSVPRGDHHDLWIDPLNSLRMINGSDGGVAISVDGSEHWLAPELPLGQFYHVAADSRVPYYVCGAMQDLGTASGPSNSLSGGAINSGDWVNVGGGESGFVVPDPADPDVVYAGNYGGSITRYNAKTKQSQNISAYPIPAVGRSGAELRYRFQWTAPILVSTHDPKAVYHASNVLFETRDAGRRWTAISPDLTRNDKSKQQWAGGPITGDNTGAEIYCTIFALAESPRQRGFLWAGTDDGLVHLSRDDGKSWANLTANIQGLPEWGTVSCIEPSSFDLGTAYLVVDAHRLDDMHPYLFKTSDFGRTWQSLSTALPQDVFLHVVREDPKRRGMLYLGTDRGVLFSVDDGASWQALKLNLPTVPIHDLVVKDNDLVIGTHGRSIWIFDDLTPIRAFSAELIAQEASLLPATGAIRWRYGGGSFGKEDGENPPQGAIIHYYLKKKPKGGLTLEILDSQGAKVNTLIDKPNEPASPEKAAEGAGRPGKAVLSTEAGVNRIAWDLTYAGPTTIPGALGWPSGPDSGPLVIPGTYTLKLTVEGKTCTQPLVIRPDPRVHVSQQDLEDQVKLAFALRDNITQLSALVKQIRSVKQQLTAKKGIWKEQARAQELVKSAQDLIDKLDALESKLHNPKAKIYYDLLAQRGGTQLYSQLNQLYYDVIGSDAPPTESVREMHAEKAKLLQQLDSEFKGLIAGGLKDLSARTQKLGIPDIVVSPAAGP
ncbi:MAG TPA: hypothetical protein VK395_08055 [Gemmataceae bacterium]|nr:hypothetical protein [Gemmataceae bacterium]